MTSTTPAPVYVNDHSKATTATHRLRTAQNSSAYLLPHLQPHFTILDVGCGPGTISIDLARLVPNGRLTALDYTSDPVEETRALAMSEGVNNVDCFVGDVHHLQFPDNTFDVVHASQVLQHVADPVQALREMRRVIKVGGILAVRESASLSWYPEPPGVQLYWKVYGTAAAAKGGNPHPGARIHAWAHEAGFDRSTIHKSGGSWCYSNAPDRQAWGQAHIAKLTESGFARTVVQENFCSEDDLKAMMEGWTTWANDEDGWFAVWHGEILCWK